MQHVDAVVVGGGPAGLVLSTLLARHDFTLALIAPELGSAPAQAQHVHVLSDATWDSFCALMPDLAQFAATRGALLARGGATSLDSRLTGHCRPYPDRAQLEAALADSFSHGAKISVLRSRAEAIERCDRQWIVDDVSAPLLVDASGGARATVRDVARWTGIEQMEWGQRRAYASMRLSGVRWPEGRLGHAARGADGDAVVVRRVGPDCTLVTLQLMALDAVPECASDFRARLVHIAPTEISGWLNEGTATSEVARWISRRSSALLAGASTEETGWMAVGDALLYSAPHMGQGLAQIAQQMKLLDAALTKSADLCSAVNALQRWTEQRVMGATLGEHLDALLHNGSTPAASPAAAVAAP